MKTKILWMLVLVMVIATAPAYSGDAVQMWRCEMEDDATEAAVEAGAQKWLKAAKKLNGGENLEAYVYFPVAVNATGQMDMMFVVVAPTFEEWGKFWDAYGGSEAAEIENQNNALVVCPDSVVWEATKVE